MRGIARALLSTSAALIALGAGCARSLPAERTSAALYRDLERLVTVSAAGGWQVDRFEVEEILPEALMSVCRVESDRRGKLLDWIDREIAFRGGPVEEAYRESGNDLSAVRDLLELSRIRLVLAAAIASAPRDCPFWIEPRPDFRGRQVLDDRWVLSMSGGGQGILVSRGGERDFRAGGSGRLLVGRAFGSRSVLMSGLDVGGNAAFPRGESGERSGLVIGADVVVPVVYRHVLVNTYVEGATGFLVRITERNFDPEPGFHLGFAVGASTTRTRWLLPGAAFAVSYERTFPSGSSRPLNMLKAGVRVVFDFGF